MKATTESALGRTVLTLAHIAGMIDLVALPVWVGAALIGQYGLSPAAAGGMVTAYLVAAVVASALFAPRFDRHAAKPMATLGFTVAAAAFLALTQVSGPAAMAALHALAGFGAGVGLSFTHGTIGRSAQPHRLFAVVTTGLGITGILFLGIAQGLVPRFGGPVLFMLFAGLMVVAAAAAALTFPKADAAASTIAQATTRPAASIPVSVKWAIAGLTLMTVTQAMVFSFVERIGAERGFGDRVLGVLIAVGFVNLLPAVIAALLERRLAALHVAIGGALVQLALALAITQDFPFPVYAVAVASFVAVIVFTHTFVFGWLAAQDRSGRAVALTPAMVMSGAAIGPAAAGLLVGGFGTASLGVAAGFIAVGAVLCYGRAKRLAARPQAVVPAAVAEVPS